MQLRRMIALVVAAFALAVPATAAAATTYTDTISGYEYFFTSTDGRFAGTASGAMPGYWNADVQHTALCYSCTPTGSITGGSFDLATTAGSVLVTGRFASGSIQLTNPSSTCSNQVFSVVGQLADVRPWSGGSGTGVFSVTLTHYRFSFFGSCVSYAASVDGTLSLTF